MHSPIEAMGNNSDNNVGEGTNEKKIIYEGQDGVVGIAGLYFPLMFPYWVSPL